MTSRFVAAAVFVALATSGCAAKAAKDGTPAIEKASSFQCVTDREVLAAAIDSYTILERKAPLTEAEMVPNYLRRDSPFYDLDATGRIVPAPGSACT